MRLKVIQELAIEMEDKRERAEDAWRKSSEALLSFDDEKRAMEALFGIHANSAAQSWWDLGTVAIILWGVVVLAAGYLLALHSRRRQLRSQYRFKGKMGVVALLVCVLGSNSLATADEKTKGPESKQWKELEKKLAEQQDRLQAEIKKSKERIEAKRHANLDGFFPGKRQGFQSAFVQMEEKTYREFQSLLTKAKIVELASAQALKQMEQVNGQKAQLAEAVAQQQANFRIRTGIKIGLCLGFAGLAFVPMRRARRQLSKEQEEQTGQCPRCLATGALQLKMTDAQDERYPEPQYLECGECQHEFRASYQKLPRICFPTVGIRGSGKTHWLVTAYDLAKRNRVPVRASIQNAPSLADPEFDQLIEQTLENHKGARGTSLGLPLPLVFHVQDRDRLGRNAAILNLFDFSGEIMAKHINSDTFRRRALLMDGFVLFLDPTQVQSRKDAPLVLKDQVKALSAFHEEMRDMRGIDAGTPVPVPIAVCISKLDLLTTHSPYAGQARPWLKSLRESFGRPVSLAEMQIRSKLCEQALAVMFPGWNLTRTLEENFGGRYMFFPMTPVGLVESELGQSDLSKRTFSPVGVFEPICWLLHMHGYCIL
jgi:hypothetical protein